MALHRARPVQRSNAAHLHTRNRSVSARPCLGAPPSCPMQKLSGTPQTRPINDRPPTQICWSAACAYAKRRERRRYLVAGGIDQRAAVGLQTRRKRWSGRRAYAAAYAHACSTSAVSVISPEKLDPGYQAGPPRLWRSSLWSRRCTALASCSSTIPSVTSCLRSVGVQVIPQFSGLAFKLSSTPTFT